MEYCLGSTSDIIEVHKEPLLEEEISAICSGQFGLTGAAGGHLMSGEHLVVVMTGGGIWFLCYVQGALGIWLFYDVRGALLSCDDRGALCCHVMSGVRFFKMMTALIFNVLTRGMVFRGCYDDRSVFGVKVLTRMD